MAYVNVEDGYNEIVDVGLFSGDVEPLTTVSVDEPDVVRTGLDWAGDGQRLFYTVYEGPGRPGDGIWEFDRLTGASRQLLITDPELGPPTLVEVADTGDFGLIIYVMALASGDDGRRDRVMLADFTSGEVAVIDPTSASTEDVVHIRTATFSADDGSAVSVL